MSNTEFVMVPRELLDRVLDPITSDGYINAKHEICALMAKPSEQHQGEPVACSHEWTDDGEFLLVCTKCGIQENHDPKWRDMATAPRDGTLVRLLVEFTEHATEDEGFTEVGSPTIGANYFKDTGEDVWQFAGWSWEQDCFTRGAGEPVGWLPLLDTPRADPGEVERIHQAWQAKYDEVLNAGEECNRLIDTLRAEKAEQHERFVAVGTLCDDTLDKYGQLQAQLAERDALLREAHEELVCRDSPVARRIYAASAEPSAPKCEHCKGHGVIGWTKGQTAESFEQGESPCEDCNATGYAHSNGMPVSGACTTCNGLGTVPDGEIAGLDGVEFENGPIECIKDCPDCAAAPPAERDERAAFEAAHDDLFGCLPRTDDMQSDFSLSHANRWKLWQARAALERKS